MRPWPKEHRQALGKRLRQVPPTASVCATQNSVPRPIHSRAVVLFGKVVPHKPGEVLSVYLLLERETHNPRVVFPPSVEAYGQAVEQVMRSPYHRLVAERDGFRCSGLLWTRPCPMAHETSPPFSPLQGLVLGGGGGAHHAGEKQ